MTSSAKPDLARTTFQLLALGVLIVSVVWVVRPFVVATIWAITIAVSTWPLLLHAQAAFGGRRSPAVAAMTIALLLVLLVPFYLGISAVVEHVDEIASWSTALAKVGIPQPPAWLEGLPVIGAKLATRWRHAASASPEDVAERLAPVAHWVAVWFVGQVGSLGLFLVQMLLTVVIVAILYANGETAARGVDRFARRLAGARGEDVVHLAAQAVRAVALGVVVTAIVQSALSGLGLAVVGVPFVTVLVVLMFVLAIAQIGPMPVLVPAMIWVYSRSGSVWGTAFLAWALVCGALDNVLRPVLIRRGADLPLLLVFAGVIGGLIAFGIIGLFIGPVVLAVAYTLLSAWVAEDEP
jgi:predicted PurR-regulated permease PerM